MIKSNYSIDRDQHHKIDIMLSLLLLSLSVASNDCHDSGQSFHVFEMAPTLRTHRFYTDGFSHKRPRLEYEIDGIKTEYIKEYIIDNYAPYSVICERLGPYTMIDDEKKYKEYYHMDCRSRNPIYYELVWKDDYISCSNRKTGQICTLTVVLRITANGVKMLEKLFPDHHIV